MANFYDEETMKELVRAACPPAAPSFEFKAQLLQELSSGAGGGEQGAGQWRWRQPKFWIPMAAGIISGFIGYGAWLGQTMSAMLAP